MQQEGLESWRRVVLCEICRVRRRVRLVGAWWCGPSGDPAGDDQKRGRWGFISLFPLLYSSCVVCGDGLCVHFVSMEVFRNFIQWYHPNKQTLLGHDFPLSTDWQWVVMWSIREAILCSARVPVHMVLLLFGLESQGGSWFNIKMPSQSHQYRKSHCWDKTILRLTYLHHGISYTGKMASLFWIGGQISLFYCCHSLAIPVDLP